MVLVGIAADALTSVSAESFCPEELSWLVVVGIAAEAVAFDDAAGAVSLIGDERKESEDEGIREKNRAQRTEVENLHFFPST